QHAHQRGVRLDPPMLRRAVHLQRLEPLALPATERGQPQPPRDDPVHLLPHQQLGQPDLVGPLERRHRLIPDLEQHGAGNRVLVVLDFPLDEQLVLALEADLGEDTRPRRCGRNVDNIGGG
ncbi:MAG: hypothetical protein ACK56I_07540, partial [bacterium]